MQSGKRGKVAHFFYPRMRIKVQYLRSRLTMQLHISEPQAGTGILLGERESACVYSMNFMKHQRGITHKLMTVVFARIPN
jgi:hypothetical protein